MKNTSLKKVKAKKHESKNSSSLPSFSTPQQSKLKSKTTKNKLEQSKENIEAIYVHDMDSKSVFVSRMALIFVIYFGFGAIIVSYIQRN